MAVLRDMLFNEKSLDIESRKINFQIKLVSIMKGSMATKFYEVGYITKGSQLLYVENIRNVFRCLDNTSPKMHYMS